MSNLEALEGYVDFVGGSKLKVGSLIVINNRPCKISSISVAKPGKHGSTKTNIMAKDIFTNKKVNHVFPTQSTVTIPVFKQEEYSVLNTDDDGYIDLLDSNGEQMPNVPIKDDVLLQRITKAFNAGETVLVSVKEFAGERKVENMKIEK